MAETLDPLMLDKRVVQRFIKKGLVDQKEYDRHVKALPDLAEKCAPVEATIEPMHIGPAGTHAEEE